MNRETNARGHQGCVGNAEPASTASHQRGPEMMPQDCQVRNEQAGEKWNHADARNSVRPISVAFHAFHAKNMRAIIGLTA